MLKTVNRLLAMQSQIWNVKHKNPKSIWVSNVAIGGFNQSEAHNSLCSRFALHNKTVHSHPQKEDPWG